LALAVALSGGIIMIVGIMIFGIAMPSLMNAQGKMSQISQEQADIQDSILKTRLNTLSIVAGGGDSMFNATIENNGLTKLFDYQAYTVIVTYQARIDNNNASNSVTITEKLSFSGISDEPNLSAGKWQITNFNSDYADPKILNSGESMEIECSLSNTIESGPLILTISTDNGVTSTKAVGVV
jgi:hypothetical protein